MESKRSPEQLAEVLDKVLPAHQDDVNLGDASLNVAIRLAMSPRPKLSPEARERIRAKVLAQPTVKRKVIHLPTITPRVTRWVAGVLVAVLMINLAIFPAMASSVPGDVLYPVKRNVEKVEWALARSDASQAKAYLRYAGRRIKEHETLLAQGKFDGALLDEAIEALDQSVALFQTGNNFGQQKQLEKMALRAVFLNEEISTVLETAQITGMVKQEDIVALQLEIADNRAQLAPALGLVNRPDELPEQANEHAQEHRPETIPPQDSVEEIIPEATMIVEPVEATTFATIVSGQNVNVRSGPSTSYSVIQTVHIHETYEYIEDSEDGLWILIRFENGVEGWISSRFVNVVSDSEAASVPDNNSNAGGNGNPNTDIDNSNAGGNGNPNTDIDNSNAGGNGNPNTDIDNSNAGGNTDAGNQNAQNNTGNDNANAGGNGNSNAGGNKDK